ncbi:Uncharacterized protein OBRU01_03764 [Operophtera brumata]|uniref:DDE Tnp4 domain-containing protein n=1 Tax=Operophtera brumata TaxID=104452 RepID=A0A0L7LR12_OPEBR|nr:Uncharacterized protein OBRU01_03764 [Operophtera brumata]
MLQVLCALNYFGTGSYQTPVGNNYVIHLSQPSASRFYRLYGFPGCIGCIDCTHVAIVPPAATMYDERSYVNRKNYHSINTQLICDASLKIMNVNSLFPGSTHDSHIWNSSNVLTLMESLHNHGHTNYHLIGDSGYALRPWCLTPLAEPGVGTAEHRYNEALKQTRATIERCNGVLKSRFRCLLKDRVLHYTPHKASKIIIACTILHNMCIQNGIEDPEMILDQDQLGMMPQVAYTTNNLGRRTNVLLQSARQKQGNIVRNYFV